MVIEEAKERGMTEEEFRRITVKRKDKTMHKNLQNFDIKPSGKIPVASSGSYNNDKYFMYHQYSI